MTIRELKKGEFFTLKPIAEPKESQVYIRDEYDRTSKKYTAYKFNDINAFRELKPNTQVYTDFTF
jgi:hypothetical protein